MDDEFDAARGILTGCVLSLGLVAGPHEGPRT